MHRAAALCIVFGLVLLALWRLRPEEPPATLPMTCPHPVGIANRGRPFVLCWHSARIRLSELQQELGLPRCAVARELPAAVLVEMAEDPCHPRLSRLPAGWWLPLGLPIDLNQAPQDELQTLPRIGPVLARRIVENRQRHGAFPSVAALRRVRGIGPITLKRLRGLVEVVPSSGR